jgi:hypothetical protein
MQLDPAPRPSSVLSRLRAAACVLLAVGVPAVAAADETSPRYQLDASTLLYREAGRVTVIEPVARITRLFDGGGSLGAEFTLDVMTGASPTGGRPAGGIQTITTPSGNTQTVSAGELPMNPFRDERGAVDVDWQQPIGTRAGTATGAHFSLETDYQSIGVSEKLSLETMQRLLTLTVGGGYNRDDVFPVGGIPVGLTSNGERTGVDRNAKEVLSLMAGVSRVVTRRWLVGINASRSKESGYLTEPYKVVSVVDPATQEPLTHLTELRPSARQRNDLLASSVYHLSRDILYLSYRYYWDDWGLRSHTVDLKYRFELGGAFLQPHVRAYAQTAADFYTLGLVSGAPLPAYASSDQRLAHFNSLTGGLTYGFRLPGHTGELTVRAEYIGQFENRRFNPAGGENEDGEDGGTPVTSDPFAPLSIGTLTLSYSRSF